jgi:DNA-binding transcriptional ArsR family regulator
MERGDAAVDGAGIKHGSTHTLLTNALSKTTRTARAKRLHPQTDREYIVPVLLKSVEILELLHKHPEGMKIDLIHERTGVARSTVYRIVRTYVASGYIDYSSEGRYVYVGSGR